MIQGTFVMIQGTFVMIQGTFVKIQGTFVMIQGTFVATCSGEHAEGFKYIPVRLYQKTLSKGYKQMDI